MSFRTFEQAVLLLNDRVNLERLQSFSPETMEGRLSILQQALDSLNNPEVSYRTVHITGTKGKGSTCVMLESMLRQNGLRVGRFTSPHIDSFCERLMINGIPCPDNEFTELFFSVHDQIPSATFASFTYFELLTLLAFVYFARKKVDFALFEVGLGGRLDATNLCRPNVSIITSISFDHTMQLGNTLTSIAVEKSGIIKPHVPVVTTEQNPEPLQIIRRKAHEQDAPIYVLDEHFTIQQNDVLQNTFRYETLPEKFPVLFTLDNITLAMSGKHQFRNASAALSAFLLLQRDEPKLSNEKIAAGLQQAFIPLRGEIYRHSDNSPTLVFDGAHNRASMKALTEMMLELFPNRRRVLIFGASQGKDVKGMFAEIADHFDQIVLTQSSNLRCLPPQKLRQLFMLEERQTNITVIDNAQSALEKSLEFADPNDVICITGSLYLAAELRRVVF